MEYDAINQDLGFNRSLRFANGLCVAAGSDFPPGRRRRRVHRGSGRARCRGSRGRAVPSCCRRGDCCRGCGRGEVECRVRRCSADDWQGQDLRSPAAKVCYPSGRSRWLLRRSGTTPRRLVSHRRRGNRRESSPARSRHNTDLPQITRQSLRISRCLSLLQLLQSKAHCPDLILFRIIFKSTGNGHGFLKPWMDEISMASLATAIHEPGSFQLGDQIPDFGRHQPSPVLLILGTGHTSRRVRISDPADP